MLVAVALTIPAGRLGRRHLAAVVVTGLIGLVTFVALATTYDPVAWGWCRCMGNPLASSTAADTYLVLVDAGTLGRIVILLIGLGSLLLPWRRPRSAVLAFVATYALLTVAWVATGVLTLAGRTPITALDLTGEAALVLLPVFYVVGFATQRPSRAHVADLLLAAREEHNLGRLRDLVARAVGDPLATVAWWDSRTAGYLDHRGQQVEPDSDAIRIEVAERPIALVLSDRLGDLDSQVRDSVAEALLLAAENRRLNAELQASLEQVRDSRTRILTASDDTRRRIERDLHDGAQQLLISTGIKLNLAAAQAQRGDVHTLARVLEEAQAELNRALLELRSLASGIAPTALVHGSLENALRELALRSPVPATVRVTGTQQPDEHTTATVYFVVAECLANVAKHSGANRADVDVALGDPIGIRVLDDGHGGATLDSPGSGLRGLVDRVEARGGRLDLLSGSEGTTVSATVPVAPAPNAQAAP